MEEPISATARFSESTQNPSMEGDHVNSAVTETEASKENEHCRICRGEGTPEEPLFYPCKCNGSIRYVHQSCLMQWLSHSQKKHCELCKTPFRFTKLYNPHMPSTVPWPVFIRKASGHSLQSLLKCARWTLVLFVWLGWVPWCMRAVWRGLFWVGDGSWMTQEQLDRHSKVTSNHRHLLFPPQESASAGMNATTWVSISQALNLSSPEPMILWFGRRILNTIIFPYSALANTTVETRWVEGPARNPSLLSGVGLLKAPTRWRLLNDTIVDILEGQLITIGILVTFILMFLIREWVVQQQPMINLGAALEGEAANLPQRPVIARQDHEAQEDDVEVQEDTDARDLIQPRQEHGIEDTQEIHAIEESNESGDHQARLVDQAERIENDEQSQHAEEQPPQPSLTATKDEQNTDSTIFNNWTNSTDTLPPSPHWSQHSSLRETDTNGEDYVDEAISPIEPEHAYMTPPRSEFEDFGDDGPLITIVDDDDEELDIPSTLSSPSRPAMPSKEIVAQASVIARTLEEQSLAVREASPGSAKDGLDPTSQPIQTPPEESNNNAPSNSSTGNPRAESDLAAEPTNAAGPSTRPRLVAAKERPTGNTITDWMWGGLAEETHPTEDNASDWQTDGDSDADSDENEPDHEDQLPANAGVPPLPDLPLDIDQRDLEIVRAAADAGVEPNDVEQVEDGEDMDGVMELIGMQGPLAGLLQNGMFSTVIISMTVLFGIWLPYLLGKVVLIVLANPISLLVKLPLRWTSTFADLLVDTFIFLAGVAYYWVDRFVRLTSRPLGWVLPFVEKARQDDTLAKVAHRFTWSAADRLAKTLSSTGEFFSDSDIPVFSFLAHESLRSIQSAFSSTAAWFYRGVNLVVEAPNPVTYVASQLLGLLWIILGWMKSIPSVIASLIPGNIKDIKPNFDILKISLEIPARSEPLKISQWSASDRVLAVLLGYAFFASLGYIYLKVRKLFREPPNQERPGDGLLVDILNQAGGVFKVILIITIEMLIFPLYCGFLLDTALLPLFGNASLASRMAFLNNSPWTSVFIHWFAGTCYMFHFALFVAMCRKILRTGVLYFIRDPDDPSFHPVRDVLERNVTTQLRKILFSAMVYGALVIVCLGAVVWGISIIITDVFPIHWSSNEPVLEFPADLLVYNFLMPVAVKAFKPSTGLQDMYNWWFRKCARFLRLSHFLFNERNEDEEGYVVWKKVAPDEEVEEAKARKEFTWPIFRDGRLSWRSRSTKQSKAEITQEHDQKQEMDADPPAGYKKVFVHNGRTVRAPASDQVRIPKGNKTFVDIDPVTGDREDGLPDNPTGLHGKDNKMFSNIYVPPYFRFRIATFIVLIWAFAATTGVWFTIIPLLLGRFVFSRLIQSHPRMNDVYAFAIGFYLLAGPVWLVMKFRTQITNTLERLESGRTISLQSVRAHVPKAISLFLQSLRLVYFYGAFMVLLPSLLGLIWEAYILIPLHTYFQRTGHTVPSHTVHFVSDWTLGVLFVRVAVHVMLKYPQSRPTKALLALVTSQNRRISWWNPDTRLATRAFIIPLTTVSLVALLLPLGLTRLLLSTIFEQLADGFQTLVYRYSYPAFMALNLSFVLLRALGRGMNKWRSRVRDEVYLIGERLHNFDDKRGQIR